MWRVKNIVQVREVDPLDVMLPTHMSFMSSWSCLSFSKWSSSHEILSFSNLCSMLVCMALNATLSSLCFSSILACNSATKPRHKTVSQNGITKPCHKTASQNRVTKRYHKTVSQNRVTKLDPISGRVLISGGKGTDFWRRRYWFLVERVLICGREGADFWRRGCWSLEESVPISGGECTDLWRRGGRFLEERVPISGGEGTDFWRNVAERLGQYTHP